MSEEYTSIEQRVSYGIGRQMGDQLAQNSFEGVDPEAVASGVRAALLGEPSTVEETAMRAAFEEIQQRMNAAQAEQAKAGAAEGDIFLAENAKRADITVTDSGLQYEVLAKGDGEKPSLNSTVRTHYHGTLIDGTVFDSSVSRGEPTEFPVSGVIGGWTEALQLMPVGAKWKLYVPYHLAYGEQGAGGAIGPYTALIFEVELLAIVN